MPSPTTAQQVIKAGCILINTQTKKIGLIYREKHQDYTFAKGHLEANETLYDCALRETEEETQRKAEILAPLEAQTYTTKKGKICTVHWYLAKDMGPSLKIIDSHLQHQLIWQDPASVKDILTHENLKNLWLTHQAKIISYL